MKLPAPLIKAWGDLQLNFDAIARQVDPFTWASGKFAGPWSTVLPASATVGVPFTLPKSGPCLIECIMTAYSTTGLGIGVEVYLDGALAESSFLNPTSPTNVRVAPPASLIARNLKRGAHYIYYRQTTGVSDVSDYGVVSVIQP